MSNGEDFDEGPSRKNFLGPYTTKKPVPTVQKYKEIREEREESDQKPVKEPEVQEDRKTRKAFGAVKAIFRDEDGAPGGSPNPYGAKNRNVTGGNQDDESGEKDQRQAEQNGPREGEDKKKGSESTKPSDWNLDPRQKRKNMKHMKRDATGREVTDPVTHLPVTIRDETHKNLNNLPGNEPAPGSGPRTSTGLSGASKSDAELEAEGKEGQAEHEGMENLFPPPEFDVVQDELVRTFRSAIKMALSSFVGFAIILIFGMQAYYGNKMGQTRGDQGAARWWNSFIVLSIALASSIGAGWSIVWFTNGWLGNKVRGIWQDEVWDAARNEANKNAESPTPESTQWLNSLLSSIWPLINPDLFTSLADTLEDVMQASLPKLVRMVSVEDLGQGSESIRILGVRWLPTGAAARSVSVDGKLKSAKDSQENSDRKSPGQGEIEKQEKEDPDADKGDKEKGSKDKSEEQEKEQVAEGMEAEQGDFVNLEIAFAYRARSSGRSLRTKAKNAHLYLAFYLPGGIKLPVWVALRGIVGTMRMRLQLTPDPPFVSLATITFLGQPNADLSCVPLSKHNLNLMDVPLISSFVQSSIDAALAEYVAPKSLTLDLKDMLVGDDFKKDTFARGVVVVRIKRAKEFKEGDGNLGPLKKGSSDPYVTVGWGKFGKPVASTRVIIKEMEPFWNEMSYVLVGPDELNAEERLKIQLWDSDTTTADDHLGFVEVDLKYLMQNSKTKGKMCDRHDELRGDDGDEKMPGYLEWSVGYFPKTQITPQQMANQSEDSDIRSLEDLRQKVDKNAERKLRESNLEIESQEIKQQKAQDYKEREDQLIISTAPPKDYLSGILSIQIHNITGLEFEKTNKNRSSSKNDSEEAENEHGEDLPSSYCTIIVNHQKVFQTRTKPKNAKPFFNAGTERFIRDWRSTEILISCRDSRVHENDPLLGVVHLPLAHVLHSRSQIIDQYPLAGGIGYGRARISIVFRSIELQSPPRLLGWDYGTLEFTSPISSTMTDDSGRPSRLKLRTPTARAKMYPQDSKSGGSQECQWKPKHDQNICLAVRKRYSTCLVLEFRKSAFGPDKTPAFAILWLNSIPDQEKQTVKLPIYPGDANLKRAETNCDISTNPENGRDQLGASAIGEIEFEVKFWRGLSGYHQKLASKDPNLKDVMECLDVIEDQKDSREGVDYDDDSDADSSDIESGPPKPRNKDEGKDADKTNEVNGKRGPIQQMKDYKQHSGQLHRQHRGLMQWKAARTADWIKTKTDHGKDHVMDKFRHNEREPGIETEV